MIFAHAKSESSHHHSILIIIQAFQSTYTLIKFIKIISNTHKACLKLFMGWFDQQHIGQQRKVVVIVKYVIVVHRREQFTSVTSERVYRFCMCLLCIVSCLDLSCLCLLLHACSPSCCLRLLVFACFRFLVTLRLLACLLLFSLGSAWLTLFSLVFACVCFFLLGVVCVCLLLLVVASVFACCCLRLPLFSLVIGLFLLAFVFASLRLRVLLCSLAFVFVFRNRGDRKRKRRRQTWIWARTHKNKKARMWFSRVCFHVSFSLLRSPQLYHR